MAHRSSTRCSSKRFSTRTSAGVIALVTLFGTVGEAHAVSRIVRDACREDYFNYCGKYEVGSAGLRACMRKNQRRLSGPCVSALVSAGEATPAERARARGRYGHVERREAEAAPADRYEPHAHGSRRTWRGHDER